MSGIINDHKTHGEWKIYVTIAIHLISSKDSNETHTMDTGSDNMEIMIGNETDEIIEELFESLSQKYQEELEEPVKGSEFVFDSIDLLYCNLHKRSLNRGRSYTDSPKCFRNKKALKNPQNNDDKCFQYSIAAVLNVEQIETILKEHQILNHLLINTIRKKLSIT